MQIDKDTLKQFRKELKTAVLELERKYDVVITPGNINYSDVDFTITVKVENTNAEAVKLAKTLANYPWFKDWHNKTFVSGRHTFTIIGYEPGKKYSIVCRRDDGGIYNYAYTFIDQTLQR